jgi:septal ring factor EnvC (AmiA/AmiB activator)
VNFTSVSHADSVASPAAIHHSTFVIRHSVAHAGGHLFCFEVIVQNAGSSASARDITFACVHCRSPLVVDVAAAGMTLECQRCKKPTPVPTLLQQQAQSAKTQNQISDLERQLKENESQRTEITSYINQLSIQLHRWQLRLQTLNERRQQLEKELRATHVV